ncbi:MarR family transcriptional regulator [Embleya sp. NBC_00896]|uniref:MarR family transcriptional regulator n=1 Tax=Embleya sp. NBC_00896 TaxID=2975961 RepID=UPI0038702258|nr:MarR family transcriptional regulator [Embleya sp. NBC_00896]
MTIREHTVEELAAQPVGYWSTAASRAVLGRIRADLGVERLGQPHWWTLNHVAGAPGTWTRTTLAARLDRFADPGVEFDAVFADLIERGWLVEHADTLTLTDAGEAGRQRARARMAAGHEQMHVGVSPAEYAAALNVLRRIIDNLGADSDLP